MATTVYAISFNLDGRMVFLQYHCRNNGTISLPGSVIQNTSCHHVQSHEHIFESYHCVAYLNQGVNFDYQVKPAIKCDCTDGFVGKRCHIPVSQVGSYPGHSPGTTGRTLLLDNPVFTMPNLTISTNQDSEPNFSEIVGYGVISLIVACIVVMAGCLYKRSSLQRILLPASIRRRLNITNTVDAFGNPYRGRRDSLTSWNEIINTSSFIIKPPPTYEDALRCPNQLDPPPPFTSTNPDAPVDIDSTVVASEVQPPISRSDDSAVT